MPQKRDKKWRFLYAFESEIYSYIKNAIGDGDVARDLCQDVYLTALQKLDELDENRSLKNWLFTVTRNRVINYFHFRHRREHEEIREEVLQGKLQDVSGLEQMKQIVHRLPERQKQVLLMREVEGWSYEELAARLDMSIPAVTSLLKRARDGFQKWYLLQFMPDWFARAAEEIELGDVLRFINPFDPPLDLPQMIQKRCSNYFSNVRQNWQIIQKDFINESDISRLLKYLPEGKNLRIADCGSGGGAISVALALSAHTVYACDSNPDMLEVLRRQKAELSLPSIHLLRTDVQHLPFGNNRFDALFFVLVLHHLAEPVQVLRRNCHLLKIGGRLFVIDFLRHREKLMADAMSDVWLGFEPDFFSQALREEGLQLVENWELRENKRLASFVQIWEKSKP